MLFSTYVILPWPYDIFQALTDKLAKGTFHRVLGLNITLKGYYSDIPNNRVGWNKRVGWKFAKNNNCVG